MEFVRISLKDLNALRTKVAKYKATIRNLIKEIRYLRGVIKEYNEKFGDA